MWRRNNNNNNLDFWLCRAYRDMMEEFRLVEAMESSYQAAVDGLWCSSVEGKDAPERLASGFWSPLHLRAWVERPRCGLSAHHRFLLGLIGLLVAQDILLGDAFLRVPVHHFLGICERTLPGFALNPACEGGHQSGPSAHRWASNTGRLDPLESGQGLKTSNLGGCSDVMRHHGCHSYTAIVYTEETKQSRILLSQVVDDE